MYKWVLVNVMLGETLRWTSIHPVGSEYESLHATETRISSGLMGHLAHMQTFDTPILIKLKTNANYKLPVDTETKPGRNNPKGLFFVFRVPVAGSVYIIYHPLFMEQKSVSSSSVFI